MIVEEFAIISGDGGSNGGYHRHNFSINYLNKWQNHESFN